MSNESEKSETPRARTGGQAPQGASQASQGLSSSGASSSGPPSTPAGAVLVGREELEVTIERLVAGGDGLARFQGVPVFVPRSAPGDRLKVRLTDRRPDYGRAEVVEILEPGPGRREPPCPHFERCGGCDLQHLEDDLQVRLKAAAVLETLSRIGRLEPPENLRVVTGAPWGYRLRAQLHTDRDRTAPRVGYHARGSRELVPIRVCPILVPELEAVLPKLPGWLTEGEGSRPAPRRVDLATGAPGGPISGAPAVGTLPHGEVEITVGEHTYRFDARCFFQAHRGLLAELVSVALGPEEWTGDLAVDLYAGVGLFSLPLAGRYGRVLAVEGDRLAVRYARQNVRQNQQPVRRAGAGDEGGGDGKRPRGTVEVVGQAVESWVSQLPLDTDRVLVDPPRVGLKGQVLNALMHRPPKRLTYVSCHPATLARDLKRLIHPFRIDAMALVDLFPQTGHMEVVVQLSRR